MISVKFKETIRERLPEWITAIALLCWGVILLQESPELWNAQYFNVLANVATQYAWGWAAILIGIFRIGALGINGAWRPTAHIRALGAGLSALIWAGILISYLSLPWSPPSIAVKAGLLFIDISALWFAAGDAKLADLKAYELYKSTNGLKER